MTSRKHSSTRAPQSGEFEHDVEQATLDMKAAYLRSAGLSYPAIAAEMQCSTSTAYERVKRALAAIPAEAVGDLRRIEAEHLMDLRRQLMVIAKTAHYHPRRIYRGVEVGAPVLDRGPNVAALRELRQVSESLRRLFGADAPAEVRLTVRTEVEDEIERLAAELELNDSELAQALAP